MTFTVVGWEYVMKHRNDLLYTNEGFHDDEGYPWDILVDKRSRRKFCIARVTRPERVKILKEMT